MNHKKDLIFNHLRRLLERLTYCYNYKNQGFIRLRISKVKFIEIIELKCSDITYRDKHQAYQLLLCLIPLKCIWPQVAFWQ